MIDALIAGKVYGKPASHTAKNGSAYTTTKVRVAAGNGDAVFVSVIAFAETAAATLLEMTDGDSIALAGELTPKAWTDRDGNARPGLDLIAHAVLTTYHVNRRRQAIAERN